LSSENRSTADGPARRCDRCFAEKDVSSLLQGASITCCRACRYKVTEILDFLSYYGLRVDVSTARGFSVPGTKDRAQDEVGFPVEASKAVQPPKEG